MNLITEFDGEFRLDKALTEDHRRYLTAFSQTHRVKRNIEVVNTLPDPLREAVGLPIGPDGGYYVGGREEGRIDGGRRSQPSDWCRWVPNDAGSAIIWNGERSTNYINWIEYLIAHFLEPWGYKLNGTVNFVVTNSYNDEGEIDITNNRVEVINMEDDDDR